MIGFYNYTVILTYISLLSSFIGITQLFHNNFTIAVFCLGISGFCDMFDGVVARSCKTRSDQAKAFGIQIDSLCDLVCFGVFPAVFNYKYTLYLNDKISIVSVIISCLFVLAAVIRLGYFNVMEEERQQQTTERREFYQGLPVTSISAFLPMIYILRNVCGGAYSYIFNIFTLLIAFLFVFDFKMKKPHGKDLVGISVVGVVMIVILVLQELNIIGL